MLEEIRVRLLRPARMWAEKYLHGLRTELDSRGGWHESIPQGLKPIDFIGVIGTTEVVPCYKTAADGVFRSLLSRALLQSSVIKSYAACSAQARSGV